MIAVGFRISHLVTFSRQVKKCVAVAAHFLAVAFGHGGLPYVNWNRNTSNRIKVPTSTQPSDTAGSKSDIFTPKSATVKTKHFFCSIIFINFQQLFHFKLFWSGYFVISIFIFGHWEWCITLINYSNRNFIEKAVNKTINYCKYLKNWNNSTLE